MNLTSNLSGDNAGLHGALLSGLTNAVEDRSLCFISDRVYRGCPHCGTVFPGSAWAAALSVPQACPFCGWTGTAPLTGTRSGVA